MGYKKTFAPNSGKRKELCELGVLYCQHLWPSAHVQLGMSGFNPGVLGCPGETGAIFFF